jgi:hypothetical protein
VSDPTALAIVGVFFAWLMIHGEWCDEPIGEVPIIVIVVGLMSPLLLMLAIVGGVWPR